MVLLSIGNLLMVQETTKAFGSRLVRAVEGHPKAPPTPFGRQSWLIEKLREETGTKVSGNTMSKWFNGQAMPRPDHIRSLAQVLSVDEIWLSLGRKPVAPIEEAAQAASQAKAGALALAGMLELAGGRVAFSEDSSTPEDMHISFAGRSFPAIVVTPKETEKDLTLLIPEPVGESRILSVAASRDAAASDFTLEVLDVTDCDRQSLGGFSVVVLEKKKDGQLKAPGKAKVTTIHALEELVD